VTECLHACLAPCKVQCCVAAADVAPVDGLEVREPQFGRALQGSRLQVQVQEVRIPHQCSLVQALKHLAHQAVQQGLLRGIKYSQIDISAPLEHVSVVREEQ